MKSAKHRAEVPATSAARIGIDRRNLFCIRLHFVLKERIGIEKTSTARLLTIDESLVCHFAGGRNFETTANTMTISRHGSHQKVLVDFAVIGLAHRGHVMHGERSLQKLVPKRPEAKVRGHPARGLASNGNASAPPWAHASECGPF
ncbi:MULTISPECIES: hypothetical protein [unclassified Bradyrhizobium]|uniref:hypothetical protein n=1 Tax=unclassified Bradyrhizobium TaxID=2631580 RepID=UPI001FFB968C|nr:MULTISPECIES: hypothetical protein [unclassified Bradyrhizobium]MCK1707643.1 hypothetical protein [Bradyrhizobium sp. 143]MCK1724854.1 hypothetical protein [Bradyrhizobium sp. 142]